MVKSYYTYKGCKDSTSGCTVDTIASNNITESKKQATFSKSTIKDKAGNTTSCPKKTMNVYVDSSVPTMNLVVYRNYTGIACVDHLTTTYSYRYNAIVSDVHSGLKYSKCSSSTGNITIERKNLTGTLKTAGVSEQFCLQQTAKITCKACDYVGNCHTYKK